MRSNKALDASFGRVLWKTEIQMEMQSNGKWELGEKCVKKSDN